MPKLKGDPFGIGSVIVGVDPGGEHVGTALLERTHQGWWTKDAHEESYGNAANYVASMLILQIEKREAQLRQVAVGKPHQYEIVMVVESFTLYPDKAKTQIGSDMPTSRLIGGLEYISSILEIPLVMQPAAIKLPTISLMENLGIPHRAPRAGAGGHAKDAETHAWHHLLRRDQNAPIDWHRHRKLGSKQKCRTETEGE